MVSPDNPIGQEMADLRKERDQLVDAMRADAEAKGYDLPDNLISRLEEVCFNAGAALEANAERMGLPFTDVTWSRWCDLTDAYAEEEAA